MKIKYVALLRGINVGGKNIIKMDELKTCFEEMGFDDVKTYIQSGNILFSSNVPDVEKLILKIEKVISRRFNYTSNVILITYNELKEIVESAPENFGKNDLYKYDVLFFKKTLTAENAFEQIKIKEGIDHLYKGKDVLYFSRLGDKSTQSCMNKLSSNPVYQQMTIRNWNTTTKILDL